MAGIPKITKGTTKKLAQCKVGQIIKFPTAMAQIDIEEIATEYGFRVWFFEPSDIEYQKHGRNIIRLMK